MASKKSNVTKQVEKEHQTLIRNIAELMMSIMENISPRVEVISVAPPFLDKVKELEDEHRQILSNMDGIFKDFESLQVKDDQKLQDIRNRVTEAITTLRQHVSAENHLMQTAYYQGYGGPDSDLDAKH